ncbi:hypothetical protein BCV69DRAFT_245708 [Microstroma glucosiphilum]|uniref:RING-type E3 ubiquitin transferase (cysteine targeting) n=1 Tax=Pseudomicrostroma glucosiphilum TaxID=1684307 RepID=A0A316UCB7_9BASI|nr:hypothetical protein BCV69DRAFT_245708 [Pseudomicrostroma glucosiphilum]PWN22836.1 hypothetical protein BCV69DRAFT_245708 [Pseudomicrostroma glucosiphilum]
MEHFWSQASSSSQPRISQIRRRLPHFPSAPLRIQRVSQLDAELLDAELTTMLLEPVKASMAQIRSTLPDSLEPELLALLKVVLFKYSIWDRGASYGAMLQNLRYRNEWAHRGGLQSTFLSAPLSKVQLLLYPLLTIGIPYAHERFHRHMSGTNFSDLPPSDPRRMVWSISDKLEKAYEALALANFVAFLSDGKYRTVTDRVLGMRLTYAQRTLNRNVSFEYLNRQLVWHAFTEFLLFLLPIIRPRRLLRRLMRLPAHPRILSFWLHVLPIWLSKRVGLYRDTVGRPRYKLPFRIPLVTSSSQNSSKGATSKGKYVDLPPEICAICWEQIEGESSASNSGALSVGIPTSDPLDPSSSALAPSASSSSSASRGASTSTRMQRYHSASRQFGVASNGIPYSVALLHTPYKANPCGCRYCYVCLAGKLLSEEAGEELEDSRTAVGVQQHGEKGGQGSEEGVGAWDCLRCARKIRGMERHLDDHHEDGGAVGTNGEASAPRGGSKRRSKGGKGSREKMPVEDASDPFVVPEEEPEEEEELDLAEL